jgi:hypothetical protein
MNAPLRVELIEASPIVSSRSGKSTTDTMTEKLRPALLDANPA